MVAAEKRASVSPAKNTRAAVASSGKKGKSVAKKNSTAKKAMKTSSIKKSKASKDIKKKAGKKPAKKQ